FPPWM
uniref:Tryptophyllin-T2-4 n=1 Tax=Pithecopus azureus TaxID=2034991 RepID=TY24_PITAZ